MLQSKSLFDQHLLFSYLTMFEFIWDEIAVFQKKVFQKSQIISPDFTMETGDSTRCDPETLCIQAYHVTY